MYSYSFSLPTPFIPPADWAPLDLTLKQTGEFTKPACLDKIKKCHHRFLRERVCGKKRGWGAKCRRLGGNIWRRESLWEVGAGVQLCRDKPWVGMEVSSKVGKDWANLKATAVRQSPDWDETMGAEVMERPYVLFCLIYQRRAHS